MKLLIVAATLAVSMIPAMASAVAHGRQAPKQPTVKAETVQQFVDRRARER